MHELHTTPVGKASRGSPKVESPAIAAVAVVVVVAAVDVVDVVAIVKLLPLITVVDVDVAVAAAVDQQSSKSVAQTATHRSLLAAVFAT